jgi:hypothetical protein
MFKANYYCQVIRLQYFMVDSNLMVVLVRSLGTSSDTPMRFFFMFLLLA